VNDAEVLATRQQQSREIAALIELEIAFVNRTEEASNQEFKVCLSSSL
jgi:hypothetical protein